MIELNTSQTLFFNLGIDLFSCAIALIILHGYKSDFTATFDNRLLCGIQRALLVVFASDMLAWILNGKSHWAFRALSYAVNIVFFVTQLVIAILWLRYAWYRICEQEGVKRGNMFLHCLPAAALSAVIVSSPFTHWCFYIDAAGYYHRGALSVWVYTLTLFYLLFASSIALLQVRREVLLERRRELQTIAFFAVPPLLGGAVQILLFGLNVVWPCAVISCLLILRDKESRAILQDALTGLNNRRNVERYLRSCRDKDPQRAITLLMVDIIDFKNINDRYGHELGDTALLQATNILRLCFNGDPAFLARYGGDEFVVILPTGEQDAAQRAMQKIEESFAAFNKTGAFPFSLSMSVGCAFSSAEEKLDALMRDADAAMYRSKSAYHKAK
ncbi:MAG: GGDEF domain-containing protein [Oscillospiraceae bacterium]|nr:GGDEF domain-containing protein [Oscillospiraceae bacterium]